MIEPKVSVILPTFNRTKLLPRAIASVLQQSFTELELIVVDDGSDEDIAAVVDAFRDKRIRLLRHGQQRGVSAARNTGLEASCGSYVAFQDSDDEWLLDKLEQQVELLDQAPARVGMVVCQMFRHRPGEQPWLYPPAYVQRELNHNIHAALRKHAMAFTQTWLARRTLLLDLDGFYEDLKVWEDWELLLRFSARHEIMFSDKPLVVSYATAGSLTDDLSARVASLEHILIRHAAEHDDAAFVSRLHYLLARFRSLTGDLTGARRDLRLALKARPGNIKAWILAALLAFGQPAIRWHFGDQPT